jgi:hypothetical protein
MSKTLLALLLISMLAFSAQGKLHIYIIINYHILLIYSQIHISWPNWFIISLATVSHKSKAKPVHHSSSSSDAQKSSEDSSVETSGEASS